MSEHPSSASRRPTRVSPTTYGGQAVMEGVMMRGRRWAAVAVRAPSSRIVVRSERLPQRLYGGWVGKTPFVRGLTVLWDSLGLGMKALMFSAQVAEQGEEAEEKADLSTPVEWTAIALLAFVAVGIFFLLPLGVAGLLELVVPNTIVIH